MMITASWLAREDIRAVTGMLEQAGHQALFVGGCVRNALLRAPVRDLDLSTDALPEEVMRLAQAAGLRAVPTGIAHGTVTVISGAAACEVTTFRRDVATDGRRAVVAFSTDVTEDARRRDFTMNALYCDPRGRLIDPLGGRSDLEARRVVFIEDPARRIREDYLRILRFFRFTAWYGAGIDAEGLAACATLAEGIGGLARERIGHEMLRLLAAPDPAPALAAMAQSGVLMRGLPGADPAALAVLVHLEDGLTPDPLRRLAALGGEDVASALRLSKAQAGQLSSLTAAIGDPAGPAALGYRLGFDRARDVLLLRAALSAQPLAGVEEARAASTRTLPITAQDLMPALRGAALGRALKQAERAWIASDFTLSRDDLIARALSGSGG